MFDDDVFSFTESQDLDDLEEGLVYLENLSDKIQIVQGLTILRIENSGIWRQHHETLREYRIDQVARLGIPKQTISDRRKVARGYLLCQDLLRGVSLRGRTTKLAYLPEVVDALGQKAAMELFTSSSARVWQAKVAEIRASRGPH